MLRGSLRQSGRGRAEHSGNDNRNLGIGKHGYLLARALKSPSRPRLETTTVYSAALSTRIRLTEALAASRRLQCVSWSMKIAKLRRRGCSGDAFDLSTRFQHASQIKMHH